ncbi:N-acetylglucosamine-6-phosphate deacetylase [Microvirga massiliensis]|uniref:N-acetylglucosamine-6-phosphate deacetylase n=1 Tax=Microvirga massiliensis TaxID=1033741 RepID=UPI00062B5854|nr:N-acetylglucosamine-6-phosphate deacetylase [Microvirga massiliensis]
MSRSPVAIRADRVFDGERMRERATVVLENGLVRELCASLDLACETLDLGPGSLLAPGFIDVQVNGGGGVLFNDEPSVSGLRTIAEAHRRFGTTGLLPTLISDRREMIARAIAAVREALEARVPGILGIHLEGPFINPRRKGAHPAGCIVEITEGDIDLLASLGPAGTTLVTLAPECVPPGTIRELTRRGIHVCAGHTEAGPDELSAAFEEGLAGFTHLYNAMAPLAGRAPGTVGVALVEDQGFAGIITDGFHVAPISVRLAWKVMGPARMMLVTDAMSPVGTNVEGFDLLGARVRVADGRCTLADGTLAGSALDMAAAVRNCTSFGIPLEDALAMASGTPARFLSRPDLGRIAPSACADLVALDANGSATHTWIAGELARA